MRRLLVALAAVALVASAGPGAWAQAPSPEPGLGVRLLDAPVDRRDDPRAQNYVVDHVAPGARLTRRVEVINGTGAPVTARTYAGAADIVDGVFTGADDGADGDLVDWTTLERSSLPLIAGQRAAVTVTIAVPRDASPGERYGVIWAELPPAGAGGIGQVNRVGVRIYLSVGPGGEPASDFRVDSLQAQRDVDGRPLVSAVVTNTGGRALDLRGTLALSDGPGGLSAGPFPAELGTSLAPGQTTPVTVLLDPAISGGPWRAVLSLSSGRLTRAAEATITFPDGERMVGQVVRASQLPLARDRTILIPVAAGLLVLALLLLAVGYLTSRRRARVRAAG